jgi:hypothetical protein
LSSWKNADLACFLRPNGPLDRNLKLAVWAPRRRRPRGARGWRRGGGGANKDAFSVLLDQGLSKRVEIGEDLGPGAAARAGRGALGTVGAFLELDCEDEGEEGAGEVAADGLAGLWKIGRVAKRCFSVLKVCSISHPEYR